jgi:hypothetical protein
VIFGGSGDGARLETRFLLVRGDERESSQSEGEGLKGRKEIREARRTPSCGRFGDGSVFEIQAEGDGRRFVFFTLSLRKFDDDSTMIINRVASRLR